MVSPVAFGRFRSADRAQVLTLEAVLAGVLLLGSLLFALQVTAVTPMSASTSSEQIEAQQARLAAGAVDAAVANETLEPTVLYWNDSGASFHDAGPKGFYRNGPPDTDFGNALGRILGERGFAFNVDVHYIAQSGAIRTQELVHVGTPSDNGASVTRTLTLYDDDVLYDAAGTATTATLANATTLYVPDAAPDSPLYNVVTVEVTVWRT